MLLAIFGIDSVALDVGLKLLVLFLVVTYLALIYWTFLDARRRIEDPFLIGCSVAASLFPFVGTVVYTILRPPEFIEDRKERELELRAAELRLRQMIEDSCPHCEYPIHRTYLRCPNCERRLKTPCRKCDRPLDPKWGVCPYCEAEVRKPRPERRERRTERTKRSGRDGLGERSSGGRGDGPSDASRRQPRPERSSRSERSSRPDRAERRDSGVSAGKGGGERTRERPGRSSFEPS